MNFKGDLCNEKKRKYKEKCKKGTLKLVAYQCIYILKASYVSVGWFKKAIKKVNAHNFSIWEWLCSNLRNQTLRKAENREFEWRWHRY